MELLRKERVEVLGLLPYASNYTFLAGIGSRGSGCLAVYKPTRGERPLWDFPSGTLAAREVASYVVGAAAGWHIVPPTVMRDDAPLGPGSLQLFIEHDPDRHYFVLMEEGHEDLQKFAAFDVVVNNADRKSGHVIEDGERRLWAVDHGLTFHTHPKLRTVIWDYAGLALSEDIRAGLARLTEETWCEAVTALLSEEEATATLTRIEMFLAEGRFPSPPPDRPYPWPLI